MKNFRYLLTFAAVLVFVSGCGRTDTRGVPAPTTSAPRTENPAATSVPVTDGSAPSNWQKYTNKSIGISFNYPADVFTVAAEPAKVVLTSKYFVEENYKGTPDGAFKHPFQISFEMRKKGLAPAMQVDSPTFAEAYVQGTVNGEKVELGDFMEQLTANGMTGYSFLQGIEGTNTRYSYVSKNFQETLAIKFTFITDFLKTAMQPTWYPEKDQIKIYTDVVNSLEFTK